MGERVGNSVGNPSHQPSAINKVRDYLGYSFGETGEVKQFPSIPLPRSLAAPSLTVCSSSPYPLLGQGEGGRGRGKGKGEGRREGREGGRS